MPSIKGPEKVKLNDALKLLNIKDWDVIIVGDGSGSHWKLGVGWASVTIEKDTGNKTVCYGLSNYGTIGFAEMMAYIQPLDWLSGREADRRKKENAPVRAYHVHILTDSDYCRQAGNSVDRLLMKNAGLWGVFDVYNRHGFILHWHHVKRSALSLNRLCDALSKTARKCLPGLESLNDSVSHYERGKNKGK